VASPSNRLRGGHKLPVFIVAARTSRFAYKGKSMTAQQIAEQLRVRYLAERSVQHDPIRCASTSS
jgi:TolB-like protein